MAPANLSTLIRKRLYPFARRLASPFTDSRRQRFVRDRVSGRVLANHVPLRKVARASGTGGDDLHAALSVLRGNEALRGTFGTVQPSTSGVRVEPQRRRGSGSTRPSQTSEQADHPPTRARAAVHPLSIRGGR